MALDSDLQLDNESDWNRKKNRLSSWNRHRKWRIFQSRLDYDRETLVLDVGYSDEEYSDTDNFLEKHYPHLDRVTALGIEEPEHFALRYPAVTITQYDGRIFPFDDKSFDIVWSNAVLEHVGTREHQVLFLKEIARVGKGAWITTPHRYFPIEVHTRTPLLHWLPKSTFDRYLIKRGKSWAAGSYMRLLSAPELRRLLKEAGVDDYQLRRNRIGPFTLDFVIILGGK